MAKLINALGKYVDFRTDFGMKYYFSRKEILIDFLNDLFAGEKIIKDLEYVSGEHDGDVEGDRRVMFDLHCKGVGGEFFIIEMQHLRQDFFKDRAIYYTSRLINKQIPRGKTGDNYRLPEVYFIALLEFRMDEVGTDQYFYDVVLCDKQTKEIFYNKLGYKMIVLPNFTKSEPELKTDMDQWLYLLKHLSDLEQIPTFLDKRIFRLIFSIGEVAKLKKEDLMSYEASWKQRMDARSVFATARRTGLKEGLEKGLTEGLEKGMTEGLEKGKEEGQKIGEEKAESRKNYEFVETLISEFDFTDEEAVKASKTSLEFVQRVRAEWIENKK